MTDNPTHKLDTYLDDRAMIVFCKVCSAEGEFLAQPCPGHFVANRDRKQVDTKSEPK